MGASGSSEAASSVEMATRVDATAAKADGSARIPEATIVACPLAGEQDAVAATAVLLAQPAAEPAPEPPPHLPLFKCRNCHGYFARAEFHTMCTYHAGKFVARGNPGHAWSKWSCCSGTTADHPGCTTRRSHDADPAYAESLRSLGCELSDAELTERAAALTAAFGDAFDGENIRVLIQRQSGSVVLSVPAPPTPTVGHVKTVLRSEHPRFASRNAELGTSPTIPGRPSTPLDDMLPLPADARAKSAAGEAVSLFILETPSRDVKKTSAAPVRGEDWVKVPLHPGDSLAKLALKYGMSVAQLKAANGILGSTIPVWDDEIWLPPLAAKRPPPEPAKVDPVAAFRRRLQASGFRERVDDEEAATYLSLATSGEGGGAPDVEAAVELFRADAEWAETTGGSRRGGLRRRGGVPK